MLRGLQAETCSAHPGRTLSITPSAHSPPRSRPRRAELAAKPAADAFVRIGNPLVLALSQVPARNGRRGADHLAQAAVHAGTAGRTLRGALIQLVVFRDPRVDIFQGHPGIVDALGGLAVLDGEQSGVRSCIMIFLQVWRSHG